MEMAGRRICRCFLENVSFYDKNMDANMPKRPFCVPKSALLQCETAAFAMQNGVYRNAKRSFWHCYGSDFIAHLWLWLI